MRRVFGERLLGRAAFASLALGVAGLTAASNASGGRHHLTQIRDGSVDLVMSVGWDFSQADESNGGREYLEPALRKFAEQTFAMTQGRLRICKVYVFNKRQNDSSADIYAARDGRASATIGGLYHPFGKIRMFLTIGSHAYSDSAFGTVLAHEFAHYGLFVKDEYFEPVVADEKEPEYLKPRVCDADLFTMMGSAQYVDLSMPRDYRERDHDVWGLGPTLANVQGLTKQDKYRECTKLIKPGPNPDKEDATWRTAHWRAYQMSAWELIVDGPKPERLAPEYRGTLEVKRFPSIASAGMPTVNGKEPKALPTVPDDTASCFEPIFIDGAFVAMVIDRSLSMANPGPTTPTRYEAAIKAAKEYVQKAPAGVTLTIVQYSTNASVLMNPITLKTETLDSQKAAIHAVLDSMALMTPAGNTAIDHGLDTAFELVRDNAVLGNWQYVLAISDGDIVVSESQYEKFRDAGIPIFTQGVGSNENHLRRLSEETLGEFKGGQIWQHGQIENALLLREPLGLRTVPQPSGNTPFEEQVHVSELDGSTAFRAHWNTNDSVSFQLISPSGAIVAPGALPNGASYEETAGGATYRIPKPSVGTWKTRLVPQTAPTGDFHLATVSDSALELDVTVAGDGEYPEPWFVRATLRAPQPVVGASVKATLTKTKPIASEPPAEVAFHDDGAAPDESANDGVYTAVIANVVDEGSYQLDVVAENPGGARVDSSAVADSPGAEEPTMPLSSFKRPVKKLLKLTGFGEMPQTPEAGVPIANNPLAPFWLTINRPGDVVWLKFRPFSGRYVVMTGNLISNDGSPMTTRLSLYDTDATTLLEESAEADGRAIVTVPHKGYDAVFYLKVEHTGGGVGRFAVAVAPESWFLPKKSAGSGDSGGCALASGERRGGLAPWLLVALAAGLGWRRKRARKG